VKVVQLPLVVTFLIFCWTGAMASEEVRLENHDTLKMPTGEMQSLDNVKTWIFVLTMVVSLGLYTGIRNVLKNPKLAITLGLVCACIGACFLLIYCLVSFLSNALFPPVGVHTRILPELLITTLLVAVLFRKWELLLGKLFYCLAILRF